VEKPEWVKEFGRPRSTLKNSNKTYLHQMIFGSGLNPAGSWDGKVTDYCESGNKFRGFIKFGKFLN
jgi:hypothetical protein